MNKWVLIIAFLLSLSLAVVNNLFTKTPLAWVGSPKVMEMQE